MGDFHDASTLGAWRKLSDRMAAVDRTGSPLARYQLGEALGAGGMGEVLFARDEQIGRSVAIKRLRNHTPSTDELARFLREARIQGRLEHPAVVPVHELWQDEHGKPFFVMKQLTGVTLADVLENLEDGDAATAAAFTRQRLHPWLLALGALAATLVPLVFRERIVTDGGDLVLHTTTGAISQSLALAAVVIDCVGLVLLSTLLVSLQDKDTRAVRHTLQMQQWQLSHLVPTDAARP